MPGKTRLRNDLLCVERDVKPYTLTHSLSGLCPDAEVLDDMMDVLQLSLTCQLVVVPVCRLKLISRVDISSRVGQSVDPCVTVIIGLHGMVSNLQQCVKRKNDEN